MSPAPGSGPERIRGKPGPRTRAFVTWTLRHGRAIWLVALILTVPATFRAASLYLHLKTDIEALLPREAPAVRAVDELRKRMPGLQYLGFVVDTGTAENLPAGERLVDDLAAKIRTYPAELVRQVRTGDSEERAFLEKHALLYVDVEDLREIRRRIEERRDYDVTRGMDLAIDDTPPPSLDFSDLKKKYETRLGPAASGAGGENARFSNRDAHLTMLLVEVGGFETGQAHSKRLLDRVKADVAALGGPAHYAAGMRVGYTGDVAISVEETSALMADLSLSSVLVVFAVIGVLVLYYRWWWSVVILMPPLLVAAVYSFAIASLPPFSISELNSNTAFLGSIIIGNGINFGIMWLARYVEERRRGGAVEASLVTAAWGSRKGTLAASLAAGASYAALAVTDFQGFRQFGIIGGIGMVVSWAAAQVLIPPLARWVDSTPSRAPGAVHKVLSPATLVAGVVTRAPFAIAVLSLVVTLVAAFSVRSFGAASLEYDFSKLRRADTWKTGEGYWGRRMDSLLGRYLTPMVVLSDTPQEASAVADRLRTAVQAPPLSGFVSVVRTAGDVLPGEQLEKIAEGRAIRRVVTPRIRAGLDEEAKRTLDRFLGQTDPSPITVRELPTTFTAGLRERDGAIDRAILVFPRPSHALWEGPSIERFTSELRRVTAERQGGEGAALAPRQSPRVAGSLAVSADIIQRIRHDGPLASLVAFVGAAATVLLVFGATSTSGLVLGSLVVGVLWLLAATQALGVRINFANFIAFPITFGIGIDYAVNVMTRYLEDGTGDVAAAVRSTGGAVGLCSMTTIIGYSSLLLAENRALFLFGVVAVLGELACLTTAVLVLPAVLETWNRHPRATVPQ